MFRDTAAAVNGRPTPEPRATLDAPPHVSPAHRWRCPACSALYRHPWLLAVHLTAPDADPDRPGHGLLELDAWTTVATLEPITVTPARPRRRGVPLAVAS